MGVQAYTVEGIREENLIKEYENLPFVGRNNELLLLKKTYQSLLQNSFKEKGISIPKVILIKGEAGIGKTRLINEFIRYEVSNSNLYLIGN